VTVQARREIDALRREMESAPPDPGSADDPALGELPRRIAARLETRLGAPLRRVINATGIFLHTNLGRAPLPSAAAARLAELAAGYCDLELDLETGRRSERNRRVEALLTEITGAEAAAVVNNNAAALLLVLATLAKGREVVVSRGELVEIGGSFRIPEILEAAGVRLVEVGTTNRTRLADYRRALGEGTALLLKVHPSNYQIRGFVETVDESALVELGREAGVSVLVDEGSGLLLPSDRPQLREHPSLRQLVAAGCDLACGSADKLLGGPQAGILVGRRELVARCRRNPLYRALRPDRLACAALEEVLGDVLAGRPRPLDALWQEAGPRLAAVAARIGAEVVPADAFLGGGSAPEEPIPGQALALDGDDALKRRLRLGTPPVVGYLRDGHLILDLRTVRPEDDDALVEAVRAARAP